LILLRNIDPACFNWEHRKNHPASILQMEPPPPAGLAGGGLWRRPLGLYCSNRLNKLYDDNDVGVFFMD